MDILLAFISLAYSAAPSQLSAYLDQSLTRSQGQAYIVRSFVIDEVEYDLHPEQNQMVDAIYWYPSGRIRIKLKNGAKTIDLGYSAPLKNGEQQIATYYFPADYRVIQRSLEEDKRINADGSAYRNLRSKLMISSPAGVRIFMESVRPQIYINDKWETP